MHTTAGLSGQPSIRRPPVRVALLLLAALLPVAAPSHAQDLVPDWVRGLLPGSQAPVNPMQALQLSDEQGAALAELARRQAGFAASSASRIAPLQARLAALYQESPMNPEAVAESYRQLFSIQTEIAVAAVRTYNEQLQVLDERQQAIWREMRGAPR